jgi:hypothetical protein
MSKGGRTSAQSRKSRQSVINPPEIMSTPNAAPAAKVIINAAAITLIVRGCIMRKDYHGLFVQATYFLCRGDFMCKAAGWGFLPGFGRQQSFARRRRGRLGDPPVRAVSSVFRPRRECGFWGVGKEDAEAEREMDIQGHAENERKQTDY